MFNQRKKNHSIKLGMNKNTSIPMKNKVSKPKQEWNSYLTDADQYKATKEDLLKKKQLLVSRHNILADNNDVVIANNRSPRLLRTPTSLTMRVPIATNKNENNKNDDVDALDLLEEDNTPHKQSLLSMKKKRNISNSSAKNLKKKTDSNSHGTTAIRNAKKNRHLSFDSNNSKHMMEDDNVSELDSIRTSATTTAMRTPSPQKQRLHTNTTTSTAVATTKPASKLSKFASTAVTEERDGDLVYVADEIRALFSELKYYEELSGRQSIVDTREELEEMLEDKALLDPTSYKPIMRYLTQLVCQSLTYLLKSEVDLQDQRQKYQQLSAQYHTLNVLLSPDSGIANVEDIVQPLTTTSSSGASTSRGIAFCSDELYPQSLSNWSATANTATVTTSATASTATSAIGLQTPTKKSPPISTVETSSELRRLTQAYAQDDLYPVPTDTAEYYDGIEEEDVLTALPNTSMHTDSKLSAKVASTPARFLEHMADPSKQAPARTAKLAANLPPGMAPAPAYSTVQHTPVRSQNTTAEHPSYSVSSTCTTPPVSHLHHMKYAAAHSVSPASAGLSSSAMSAYPQLNTPASYVDAYASYLPSAPKPAQRGQSTRSADLIMHQPPSTPMHSTYTGTNYRDNAEHLTVDLSRVDTLIEYSKSIAGAPSTVSHSAGDETSTIARLTDSFAAHRSPTTATDGADDSVLGGYAYSDRNASTYTNTNATGVEGASSVYSTSSARQPGASASHDEYMRMFDSLDSTILSAPVPPIPVSTQSSSTPYATPFRQPGMANSTREALQRQSSAAQEAPLSSMPGTSASDWLFSAFPSKLNRQEENAAASAGPGATADVVTPPVLYSSATSMSMSRQSTSTPTTTGSRQQQQQQALSTGSTANIYSRSASLSTHTPHEHESDATIDRLTQQLCTKLNVVTPPTPPTRAASTPVTHDLYTHKLYNQPPPVPSTSTLVSSHKGTNIPIKQNSLSSKPVTTKQSLLPQQQQEQGSIINPLPVAPSPQRAPVHPFAYTNMHHI